MDMKAWADNELDMAIKREKAEAAEADFDTDAEYAVRVYEAARQLIHLFDEQAHSGASAHLTKRIFNKLIDHEPLSPVTDEDDQWEEDIYIDPDSDYKEYQHIRNIGLFKRIYKDGHVEYSDIDRVLSSLKLNEEPCWHSGFVTHRLNELVPIMFPYSAQHIKVWCDETESNSALLPDVIRLFNYSINGGPKIPINEYYRAAMPDDHTDDHYIQITKEEFDRLKSRICEMNHEIEKEGKI